MACGLPFVGPDLQTTAMFTEGLGVADLVPAGEPAAFATALCALLEDPDRQERMSLAGPKVSRERYNWDVEVPQADGALREPHRPAGRRPNVRAIASSNPTGGVQPMTRVAAEGANSNGRIVGVIT